MTFAEYVDALNDPRRPMGLWGPLGDPAFYRVGADPGPPPARPAAYEDGARVRLEQHARAAAHDQVVARLRRLR